MTKREYKEITKAIKDLKSYLDSPEPCTKGELEQRIDALEWVLWMAKLPVGCPKPIEEDDS